MVNKQGWGKKQNGILEVRANLICPGTWRRLMSMATCVVLSPLQVHRN